MSPAGLWVELVREGTRERRELGAEPLVVSAFGGLPLAEAGADRLTLRTSPLTAVFDGGGDPPKRRGEALPSGAAVALDVGDELVWRGVRLVLGRTEAALEALDARELTAMNEGNPTAPDPRSPRAWRRVKAGLLVELGLADRAVARRVQSTVVDKSFAADAAATELLDGSPVPDDDPRLDQRSARLMRDLVMAPAQRGARGAARRAREATRSGLAWALSQFFVVGLLGLLLFVGLLILRLKLGWSVDGLLDRVLGLLPEAMRPA